MSTILSVFEKHRKDLVKGKIKRNLPFGGAAIVRLFTKKDIRISKFQSFELDFRSMPDSWRIAD